MIVYPNPSQTLFTVKFEGAVAEKALLKLYDINGRLVLDLTDLHANETISIGQDLNAGMYKYNLVNSAKQLN